MHVLSRFIQLKKHSFNLLCVLYFCVFSECWQSTQFQIFVVVYTSSVLKLLCVKTAYLWLINNSSIYASRLSLARSWVYIYAKRQGHSHWNLLICVHQSRRSPVLSQTPFSQEYFEVRHRLTPIIHLIKLLQFQTNYALYSSMLSFSMTLWHNQQTSS